MTRRPVPPPAAPPAPRRGRPPKPAAPTPPATTDPARERILHVALELFSQHGYDGVSVRQITEAAQANVSAVNYHFGSKDGLLLVLFRREAKVLVEQRLSLLRDAMEAGGEPLQQLEGVVRALLVPVLRWCLQQRTRTLYVPTLLRASTHDEPELQAMMERETKDLQPFAMALRELLPALPVDEIYWQLHFVLGLEHSMIRDLARLKHLSGGLCDTNDLDALIERVVGFAVRALAPMMDGAPGRRG